MNSVYLVILSLVLGSAIGAGVAVMVRPVERIEVAAPLATENSTNKVAAALESPEPEPSEEKREPSEEYLRIAQALVALDERISEMDAREQGSEEKVEKLLADIGELALHLEIRSGQLKPFRSDTGAPLRPLGASPDQPLPNRNNLKGLPGVTEDGLPTWEE